MSLIGEKGKIHYFLVKVLLHLCSIIHYIAEEVISVVMVSLSTLQVLKAHVNDCFKINSNHMNKVP